MLYPAREDDLGSLGTEQPSWGLGVWGEGIFPRSLGLLDPLSSRRRFEETRQQARHVRTFLFGISNFQSCIRAVYIVASLLLRSFLGARWTSDSFLNATGHPRKWLAGKWVALNLCAKTQWCPWIFPVHGPTHRCIKLLFVLTKLIRCYLSAQPRAEWVIWCGIERSTTCCCKQVPAIKQEPKPECSLPCERPCNMAKRVTFEAKLPSFCHWTSCMTCPLGSP